MANGFQIDVPGGGWSAANQGLSGIGSGIGQWARQQQAMQMMERQRQNELQDQIYLATMKAKIEAQNNPFSRIKDNVALAASLDQIGQLTPELENALLWGMPGFSPRGGFQPQGGFGVQQPFAPATINRVDQFLNPGMPRGTSLVPNKPFGQAQPFNAGDYQMVPTEFSASGRPKGFKLKSAAEKLDEMKIRTEFQANEEKAGLIKNSAFETLDSISEIEKGMKFFGPFGDIPTFPGMPEYSARKNWEVNTNKLIAEKVLKILNDMKMASKTGATGFGQLSNKELGLLQNAATALKKSLGREDAQRYLNQIKENMNKIVGEQPSDRLLGTSENQSQYTEGQTATNPKTGQQIIYKGGRWQNQ